MYIHQVRHDIAGGFIDGALMPYFAEKAILRRLPRVLLNVYQIFEKVWDVPGIAIGMFQVRLGNGVEVFEDIIHDCESSAAFYSILAPMELWWTLRPLLFAQ